MLPLSLSLSLTHSRARSLSHTLAHSLPLSLSLSHTLTHSHSHSPESGGRDEPSSGVEEAIEMLLGDAVALALAGPRAGLYTPHPTPYRLVEQIDKPPEFRDERQEEAGEMLLGDAVALALAGPRAGPYPVPCPPTLPPDP